MADMGEQIKNALEVIKDDWSKLPNFIKFCYLSGVFILLTGWLIPDGSRVFNHSSSFWLYVLMGLLIFILPIGYWAAISMRVFYFRMRYPIGKIGKDFQFADLREFKGTVHILDFKRKQIRWIENPRTLYDLGYIASDWTRIVELNNLAETVKIGSQDRNLSNYRMKRGIRTRGKPGIKVD